MENCHSQAVYTCSIVEGQIFNNCNRFSLIDDLVVDTSRPVLDLMSISMLNVKTTVPALVDEWLEVCGLHTERYFQELEGNQCSRLLRKVDELRRLMREEVQRELTEES